MSNKVHKPILLCKYTCPSHSIRLLRGGAHRRRCGCGHGRQGVDANQRHTRRYRGEKIDRVADRGTKIRKGRGMFAAFIKFSVSS